MRILSQKKRIVSILNIRDLAAAARSGRKIFVTLESSARDRWLATVPCPVAGSNVSVCATYQEAAEGLDLVEFECSGEGVCGITAWDPCPLYVQCLEDRPHDSV